MDDSEVVKESRVALRLIHEHILRVKLLLGVQTESAGVVDVLFHPTDAREDLNYITPRRNTAFVSGAYLKPGLARLQALGRRGRVQYLDMLFPPSYAATMVGLGLDVEQSMHLMVYKIDGFAGKPPVTLTPPKGIRVKRATQQGGLDLWRDVLADNAYEVTSLPVEPLVLGNNLPLMRRMGQLDLIAYRNNRAIAVARVGVQKDNGTVSIVALGLLREARTPDVLCALFTAVLKHSAARGCTIVFAPGETEDDRRQCATLGFVPLGRVVGYGAGRDEGTTDGNMGQPVYALS